MIIFSSIFWYWDEYKYQQSFDTCVYLYIPFQLFVVTSSCFAETYNFVKHHQCMVLIAFYINYCFFFVYLFIFVSLLLLPNDIDWSGRSILNLVVMMLSKRTTLNKTIFSDMKYNIINKGLCYVCWYFTQKNESKMYLEYHHNA